MPYKISQGFNDALAASFDKESESLCVVGEDQVGGFGLLVTREAGLHECFFGGLAVSIEVTEAPATGGGVLL